VAAGVLALVLLALHAPFLPASLEDHDSFNFALGLRDIDVARHQPHPPGYPVYIAAGKLANLLAGDEARALGGLAVVAGALAIPALVMLFGFLDPSPGSRRWAVLAALLAASSPLAWFTAVRPLSDMPGLAATLGAQAILVRASSPRALAAGAGLAALAAGIRSQAVWLTLPLLVLAVWRRAPAMRVRAAIGAGAAFLVVACVWFVPLLVASGGPGSYFRAFADQGTEDLTGVVMLWTTPTPRQLIAVATAMLVAPWGVPTVAAIVIALAVVGLAFAWRSSPRAIATLLAAFGPYAVFSALFQETVTTRYVLPLVPPVAYLAVRGLDAMVTAPSGWMPRRRTGALQAAAVVILAGANLAVGVPAVQAFAALPAPAVRMVSDMADRTSAGALPALAMHRRAALDLRRPFEWAGREAPQFATRLPSPPKREWLEVVKYWTGGGSEEVWFIADPLRSDLALVAHPRLEASYRWVRPRTPWAFDLFTVLGGVRPSEFDWYVFDRPAWFLGEGWALTWETGGLAQEAGRGPAMAPIEGWIRRRSEAITLMVGGRNARPDGSPARVQLAIDGAVLHEFAAAPGPFLEWVPVAPGRLHGDGPYAVLTVSADGATPPSPLDVTIKQFDLAGEDALLVGYADGWHDQEYDPSTGRTWRWTSDRAVLRLRGPIGRGTSLRLEGEMEAASQAQMTVRVGDRVLAQERVGRRFALWVPLPTDAIGPDSSLIIETDQSDVPAERRWRLRPSTDQRRLGLKLYVIAVTPAA
jgi:hypothetical protein